MRPIPPGAVAVIFVSQRSAADSEGYAAAAVAMEAAAAAYPGYLGLYGTRGPDGLGVTVSYWVDEAAAQAWRDDAAHRAIRDRGRDIWYDWYDLQVATVTRAYDWKRV